MIIAMWIIRFPKQEVGWPLIRCASCDVHCTNFWACDDGYFQCANLVVEKSAECDIQGFDTFDVSKIRVPILYAPYCDPDNISYHREVEFLIDYDEDEDDPRMENLSNVLMRSMPC